MAANPIASVSTGSAGSAGSADGPASSVESILASTEARILELLELKNCCTQSLSDEIVRRIRSIREKCQQSEKNESTDGGGQYSWRRGAPSSGQHTSLNETHTNTSTNTNTLPTKIHKGMVPISNQWRGQSTLVSTCKPVQARQQSTSRRYVSKFTNVSSPVEDKILNQVILNKLNKFSQANYQEVKEFLQQILDSNESDFLRDFMRLVFNKAACEPTFCPLYARIISELSVTYTSLLTELESLYSEYLRIFEEVNESQCTEYDQFVQRNREKMHRLGYSQFLGELTSIGILKKDQISKLYTKIFEQIKEQATLGETKQQLVEEYVDCLLRMSKSFQKGMTHKLIVLRQGICSAFGPDIEGILANRTSIYPGLSKKASFGLMDCFDIFKGSKFGT